jgi:hypothetical protein
MHINVCTALHGTHRLTAVLAPRIRRCPARGQDPARLSELIRGARIRGALPAVHRVDQRHGLRVRHKVLEGNHPGVRGEYVHLVLTGEPLDDAGEHVVHVPGAVDRLLGHVQGGARAAHVGVAQVTRAAAVRAADSRNTS